MNADDFAYDLPEELIAAYPAEQRDESRLLVLDGQCQLHHQNFRDLKNWLKEGDVLVLNNSKVFPARLYGKKETGGNVGLLLLHPDPEHGKTAWRALARPAKKLHPGDRLTLFGGEKISILESLEGGEKTIRFSNVSDAVHIIEKCGQMPLPPYILKRRKAIEGSKDVYTKEDAERYQTVYAKETGSIAAPTAGLHFTGEMLGDLKRHGCEIAELTLHVGAGTFQTMGESQELTDYRIHEEFYDVTEESARTINRAKREGRRIVAVGTTSVRTLESVVDDSGKIRAGRGQTDLLIAPGFSFRVVDCLVTNFHLPRSTLLLLVSAFVGRETIFSAYQEAIREKYRFYSYGDAMFLHRNRDAR